MADVRRRRQPGLLARVMALALAASLAACAGGGGRPRPTAEAPPPEKEVVAAPVPEAQRNRVAVLVPLSGANGALGRSIANAANLALLDSGARSIRLTVYDTAGGAAAAASKALGEGARLILGPLLAEDVRAVQPVARAVGVPVVAFSNDIGVAGGGTYVMGFVPAQSIARVVAYARSQGVERFAGLVPAGVYGQRASVAMLREVDADGGRVVAMQTYSRDLASITAAVRKMTGANGRAPVQIRPDGSVAAARPAAAPFDALLIADSGRIATIVAPLLQKSGVRGARLLGTELWNTEPGLARAPGLGGAWFASVPDAVFRQLSDRYRTRFGAPPYRLASLGYDAVLLTARIAKRWRPGAPFPEEALGDRGGFSGIDGAFRFDGGGVAQRMLDVRQVDATGFTVVSPAPRGFGG